MQNFGRIFTLSFIFTGRRVSLSVKFKFTNFTKNPAVRESGHDGSRVGSDGQKKVNQGNVEEQNLWNCDAASLATKNENRQAVANHRDHSWIDKINRKKPMKRRNRLTY